VLHQQKFVGSQYLERQTLIRNTQILATWNKREGELIAANKLDRIVAQPPEPHNVHAGSAAEDIKEKVGKEGARTIPGM
jgi:formamidase